jgi:hypothetical protein
MYQSRVESSRVVINTFPNQTNFDLTKSEKFPTNIFLLNARHCLDSDLIKIKISVQMLCTHHRQSVRLYNDRLPLRHSQRSLPNNAGWLSVDAIIVFRTARLFRRSGKSSTKLAHLRKHMSLYSRASIQPSRVSSSLLSTSVTTSYLLFKGLHPVVQTETARGRFKGSTPSNYSGMVAMNGIKKTHRSRANFGRVSKYCLIFFDIGQECGFRVGRTRSPSSSRSRENRSMPSHSRCWWIAARLFHSRPTDYWNERLIHVAGFPSSQE